MKQKAREYNYDLLRVLSMMAVILMHVGMDSGGRNSVWPIMPYIYDTFSKFAVPCFVMLSGAFVLEDKETANYEKFYRKKLVKIGLPTLFFTLLYVLYRFLFCFTGSQPALGELTSIIVDVFRGSPFYHMWYLYMLIGLYLLAPIVVRFKESISYESFRTIAIIFLVIASLSAWTSGEVFLNWDVGQTFEYLGYFMIGYVIRKDSKVNNLRGILLLIFWGMVGMTIALLRYYISALHKLSFLEISYDLVSFVSPLIVIFSVLIFAGFAKLRIGYNRWIEKMAGISFTVYLFHAGVWDFIYKLIIYIKGEEYLMRLDDFYWRPVFTIVVFLISVLSAIMYKGFKLKFYKKYEGAIK